MFLNCLILAAIIFLGYWWALQGFFSAFLHLMSAILAGALALALWEPLAHAIFPFTYANGPWGIALMGLFLVFFLVIRVLLDRLARGDVKIHPAVDYTGGGICGGLAACIAAGITLISVGFLPLPPDIFGYQPLVVSPTGTVVPNPGGDLWVPVTRGTGRFYAALSSGAFSTATPLESYQPDLARQSTLYRMGNDPNSSMVVRPGSVTATDCFSTETPVSSYLDDPVAAALFKVAGDDLKTGDQRLVAVKTTWTIDPKGTYDLDEFLRVFPTQVRLVTVPDADAPDQAPAELQAPLGFSRENPETHASTFTPLTDDKTYLYSTAQTNKVTWLFLVPKARRPQFLLLRHSRLDLPTIHKDDRQGIKEAIGSLPGTEAPAPPAQEAAAPPDNTVGLREGRHAGTMAKNILVSDELPLTVSQNYVNGAGFTIDDKHGIVSGEGDIIPSDSVSRVLAITHFTFPGSRVGVRVEVARDQAESLLGAAISAAASLAPVYMEDADGDKFNVVGYVWFKNSTRHQLAHFDLDNPLSSSRQLPVRDMNQGDKLYLYFAIPKGVKLTYFHIGPGTKQEVTVAIPAK